LDGEEEGEMLRVEAMKKVALKEEAVVPVASRGIDERGAIFEADAAEVLLEKEAAEPIVVRVRHGRKVSFEAHNDQRHTQIFCKHARW
jgi:hypothetical protein